MRIIFQNDGFLQEPFLSQMPEMVDCVSRVFVCFLAFAGNYKIACVRAYVFVFYVNFFDVSSRDAFDYLKLCF